MCEFNGIKKAIRMEISREGIKDRVTFAKEYIEIRIDATKRICDKLNNLGIRLDDFSKRKKFHLNQINQTNIINDQLAITAEKTNQNINIPLHPGLKNILEK